jgi:DNA-binding transcriptional MerR regulator
VETTEPSESTVEELAREHELPVSTVRLYQTRGLLPPPRRQGRVAYYGDEHRGRLRLITQLQERGFSLAAIKELFDGMAAGRSLQAVLGLGGDAGAPAWAAGGPPATLTLAELGERLPGVEPTPELVERIVRLGLVRPRDDGTVEVDDPASLDVGSRLMKLGVPGEAVLDEYEELHQLTDEIARRFTDVFRRHFWGDFEADGLPADRIPELTRTLAELGSLAESVVTVALRHSLRRAADDFLAAQAHHHGIAVPRPAPGTAP